jgi:hypothetical protein
MPEQNSTVNYPTIKTISDFKGKLTGGGARSNLFEVELSFPINAPIPFAQDAVDLGKYMVKAAALPSSQVNALPVAFRGRVLNVAGDRTFQSWTITVINDTDFKIRAAYERWMNYINNVASNRGETNPTNYMADARVFQLDRNGKTLRYYKMYDLFPTAISQIGLDYETDAVQQFTVELQVLYWEAYEGDYLARGPEYDVATDVEAVATSEGPEV